MDPRERFKHTQKRTDGDDLLSLWEDQRKMREEDERIAQEIKRSKQRAKSLSRQLRRHKFGEAKNTSLGLLSTAGNVTTESFTKLTKLFNKKRPFSYAFIGLVVVSVVGVMILMSDDTPNGILGESVRNPIVDDLPRELPKDFSLLYPSGLSDKDYDVVRISPPGADASYTYLDQLDGGTSIFRVTQQKVPEGFDVQKVAKDFQATSIIQVDDVTIYHGYSEQGGVQSLIFIKDDVLVSIRSTERFPDESWAAYVASLR